MKKFRFNHLWYGLLSLSFLVSSCHPDVTDSPVFYAVVGLMTDNYLAEAESLVKTPTTAEKSLSPFWRKGRDGIPF